MVCSFALNYYTILISRQNMQKPVINIPFTEKIAKELRLHNDVRRDDYYWLNQRENPRVIDYLNAENQYRADSMKHTKEWLLVLCAF